MAAAKRGWLGAEKVALHVRPRRAIKFGGLPHTEIIGVHKRRPLPTLIGSRPMVPTQTMFACSDVAPLPVSTHHKLAATNPAFVCGLL